MLFYKSITLLLSIIILSITNPVYSGDIYKWTDAQGNVHFGDKPDNAPASIYKVPKKNTANVSVTNKSRAEKQKKLTDSLQAERRDKKEKRDKKRENSNTKKYNCQVAKDRLRRYQRASGIYDRNDVGEKIYLNEKERQNEINNMKELVTKWCD